jgi:hypothetical protein
LPLFGSVVGIVVDDLVALEPFIYVCSGFMFMEFGFLYRHSLWFILKIVHGFFSVG